MKLTFVAECFTENGDEQHRVNIANDLFKLMVSTINEQREQLNQGLGVAIEGEVSYRSREIPGEQRADVTVTWECEDL